MIDSFGGEHCFLSNFYPLTIRIGDEDWSSSEHLYQAMKTFDPWWRDRIRGAASPGLAKQMGKRVPIRPDWEEVRVDVMRFVLARKFEPGSEMAGLLLSTGDELLVEGNWWHDQFWGSCRCDRHLGTPGLNWLGRLLMARRAELLAPTEVPVDWGW